jgi:riboflavin kinase/FMN adenylyltransferase
LLERLGAELGFSAHGVGEIEVGGAPVSATRIRGLLERGEVRGATELLGRPYAVLGTVVHGAGRGGEIGFPTVNLDSANEILPRYGVYIVEIALEGESPAHPGVANVGVRPTVGPGQPPVVEAHLLDFDRSCYGAAAEVRFLHRLRSERRFPSFGALRAQIAADVRFAREYFRRPNGSLPREVPDGASSGA